MRILTICLFASCGGLLTASLATAQQPQQPSAIPVQMPGQMIGKPLVQPVGTRLPQAVPSVGKQIGLPPGVQNFNDPRGPQPTGKPIDLSNVVAPYPGMPNPAPSFWTRLEERWMALFQSDQPAQRTAYTPGIGRRNRDRAKERMQMWQRD